MNYNDQIYHNLLKKVLEMGTLRQDRTNTGTYSLFIEQVKYDLTKGFPLLTTKKVHWKSVVGELLWFLEGNTNASYLKDKYGVSIWDEWADSDGELGPVYGHQWRSWTAIDTNNVPYVGEPETYDIDQIKTIINQIKNTPNDRGIIVSAWNVSDLPDMALRPCHTMFQFYVDNEFLDVHLYQRSADVFLGVPFNIASYALLLSMIAQVTNKTPRFLGHSFGDIHLYTNHVEQAKLQLTRTPYDSPKLFLSPGVEAIDDFIPQDIVLLDYISHPAIKASVAV